MDPIKPLTEDLCAWPDDKGEEPRWPGVYYMADAVLDTCNFTFLNVTVVLSRDLTFWTAFEGPSLAVSLSLGGIIKQPQVVAGPI